MIQYRKVKAVSPQARMQIIKNKSKNKTTWRTSTGQFNIYAKIKLEFTIPEMHEQRLITFNLHVTNAEMGYDMIVGMDMLTTLGIDILNSTKSIQ